MVVCVLPSLIILGILVMRFPTHLPDVSLNNPKSNEIVKI
jgi:hypothetical protein